MKRIFLFLMTNIAVMVVISVVLNLLNLNGALAMRNGDMMGLLAASAVIGFTGSIISLLMSKTMAKMSVGAQVIKQPSSEVEQWLVETVRRQAQAAGIGMPEVAMYESPEPNAFATGKAFAGVGNPRIRFIKPQRMRSAALAHRADP